jgi:hypothetical protein
VPSLPGSNHHQRHDVRKFHVERASDSLSRWRAGLADIARDWLNADLLIC